MDQKLGFVIVIEHGELEAKTGLLVESIRRVPALQACPVYVVQPRKGEQPSRAALDLLERHQAQFLYADLNRSWVRHGPMNKVYAAAHVEPLVENNVETLVFLDSDMIVVAPPDDLPLTEAETAAAAPIAEWHVGRMGQLVDQPLSPCWQLIYEVCGVQSLPDWQITTTIDRRQMYPYFNSGAVAGKPARAFFRQWHENVERLALDGRARSFSEDSREFFFLDQTSLAGTILATLTREQFRVLPHRYNYPLHAHHLLPDSQRAALMDEISFVHYHGHFSNLYWLDDIGMSNPLRAWLLSRLPLRPKLRMTRGSVALYASYLLSKFPLRPYHHRVVSHLPGLRRTIPHPARN